MANSGSNSVNIGNPYLKLRIAWTADVNTATNTAYVSATLYLDLDGVSLYVGSRSDGSLTIDGTTQTGYMPEINKTNYTGSIALRSYSRTINLNAGGTKTITVSGTWPARATLSGTYYESITVSSTGDLAPEYDYSLMTISPSPQELGGVITITTNRTSTALTHTLRYMLGSETGTIATGVTTSYAWTLPLTLANRIANKTSGSGIIYCDTYHDGALIGTSSQTFTATVPTSIVPTIDSVGITEAVSGIAAQFQAYVQGRSKLAIDIAASGAYSSTITLVNATIEGIKYSGETFTTGLINSSGTVTIAVEVTDSRGRTASTSVNVTIEAYAAPSIASLAPYRVDGTGAQSDEGTSAAVLINFAIADVNNKNTKAWALDYRIAGTETWAALTSGSDYTYNATYTNLTGLFDINNSYDIRLTLTDYFTTITRTGTLSTAFAIFNFRPSGKGVAFGKVSERDAAEFGMPAYFENGMYNADEYRIDTGNTLPAGDGSLAYWHNIPQGRYNVTPGTITGQPANYGMIDVTRYSWEFSVMWYTQATGKIYRLSGNYSTISGWIEVMTADGGVNANTVDGLPLLGTGGIIEDISVEGRGRAVKFADGTMIAYYRQTISDDLVLTYGPFYYTTKSWTFPISFYEAPVVSCSEFKWGASSSWGSVSTVSTSAAILRGMDAYSRTTGSIVIAAMAVGRWKQ